MDCGWGGLYVLSLVAGESELRWRGPHLNTTSLGGERDEEEEEEEQRLCCNLKLGS
jgi:hypothetical protein